MVIPSLMLPDVSNNSAELAILSAAIAAAFVILEYGFKSPSLVEFRFAAPYNRFRFGILVGLLGALTIVFRHPIHITGSSIVVSDAAAMAFQLWDFPGSPIGSFLMLAGNLDPEGQVLVATAAAVALSVTFFALVVFAFVMLAFSWPLTKDTFNLWINMPTFDQLLGDETQRNLRQSALVSLVVGLTLPYLAPQAALAFMGPLEPVTTGNSLFLIWMISIWCFVPAVSVLRAVALYKVAHLLARDEVPQG